MAKIGARPCPLPDVGGPFSSRGEKRGVGTIGSACPLCSSSTHSAFLSLPFLFLIPSGNQRDVVGMKTLALHTATPVGSFTPHNLEVNSESVLLDVPQLPYLDK